MATRMDRRQVTEGLAAIVDRMLEEFTEFVTEHLESVDADGYPNAPHLKECAEFARLRHDDLLRFLYD